MHVSDTLQSGIEMNVAAHVAVSFSINMNPIVLLHEVEESERPLVEKVVAPVARCMSEQTKCIPSCDNKMGQFDGNETGSTAPSSLGMSSPKSFAPSDYDMPDDGTAAHVYV